MDHTEQEAVAGPEWAVPLSDLIVDGELRAAVDAAVSSGWWSMGPRVQELERAFADFTGAAHAIAVANGTAALHIALLGCGCGPGDEVIVPSLNFVASANTILHTGATPVFCDIHGDSDLNLDPADVDAAVTTRTKAIVALHYGGFPCDMDALQTVATSHGLTIIEDAAHAPGATYHGRSCGTLGAAGCFSFFSNKNLPVGEGGMLICSDEELAERMRLLRSHGMTTLTWDRHRGHAHSYDVVLPGFNYRLDEIRAAMSLVQLRRLRDANERRAAVAARYRRLLSGREGLVVPFDDQAPDCASSHHLQVVVLPRGTNRAAVQAAMRAQGIQTSVHYPPIHQFSAYRRGSGAARSLAHTDDVTARILTLPMYPHLEPSQIDAVAAALLSALEAHAPG